MHPPTVRSTAERSAIVRQILAEMQSGSTREEHFRRLVELYYTPVYQVFAKRGFPPDDCLDLTRSNPGNIPRDLYGHQVVPPRGELRHVAVQDRHERIS